ncbi:PhoPQ-activated protein PqaA family protein [Kistimonas asteriae]|uniref:PhoPQ-activated protein PqaA family protein n=1 Tax=Kistimonas asteriae TaxID=517724 RepID=UPI001BAB8B77|nr:PhoPQ-activated protein PqaA family protein [Kistimonas asteriae]
MACTSFMFNSGRLVVLVLAGVLAVMPVLSACGMIKDGDNPVHRTALDDYIQQPDNSWEWTLEGEAWQNVADFPNAKVKLYQVSMVSQTWSAAIKHGVSEPVWRHRLMIYRPEVVRSEKAFLFIDGGTRYPRDPEYGDVTYDVFNQVDFAKIAASTGAVVVDLKDVPNQYLRFADGKPRKEDDLIAWTWYHYLKDPEESEALLLQFPMVKSAVRAMDTVQAVLSYKGVDVERFVLAGASKRGWTAWLTAAVDKRTDSLIPVVIDILKSEAFIDHVYKAHQGTIPALSDYYAPEHDVFSYVHTPEMYRLLMLVDPYRYRDRLNMPKYIVTASGDDFFPPDSAKLYLQELLGPTWMRTFPNSRHYVFRDPGGLARATDTFEAFLGARVDNRPLPDVNWSRPGVGRLAASMPVCPKRAVLWQVTNPEARDFRMTALSQNGLQYKPENVAIQRVEPCQFSIDVESPKSGWTAWFVELAFDNAPYPDMVVTSSVSVIPDLYPESSYTRGNQAEGMGEKG